MTLGNSWPVFDPNYFSDLKSQVWAAGLPGGGQQLDQGQTWTVDVPAGTKAARFWGRTGCSFDASGRGTCQTGDCNGQLSCQVSGAFRPRWSSTP
ncbi:hypothetical protein SUGI_0860510 [Cryptomeria japonica]|nr:hypothetical protein SUGI_0860510 [Cryptomeria japonica]